MSWTFTRGLITYVHNSFRSEEVVIDRIATGWEHLTIQISHRSNNSKTYTTLYTDFRIQLFSEICDISSHFATLTHEAQFLQIMSNSKHYRCASRAMYSILNRRRYNMLR